MLKYKSLKIKPNKNCYWYELQQQSHWLNKEFVLEPANQIRCLVTSYYIYPLIPYKIH